MINEAGLSREEFFKILKKPSSKDLMLSHIKAVNA